MIKCDGINLTIKGSVLDLKTELSVIVHEMYGQLSKKLGKEEAREEIEDAVKVAMMSKKELNREIMEMMRDFLEGEEEDE